jgi:hypothetical protein
LSFGDWREIKQKIAMSERVGKREEFKSLQETACVHLEEREQIGYIRAFNIICGEDGDKDFKEFLEKKGIPALVEIGRGRWYRDTITDLGLALSSGKTESTTEDAEGILDAKISDE